MIEQFCCFFLILFLLLNLLVVLVVLCLLCVLWVCVGYHVSVNEGFWQCVCTGILSVNVRLYVLLSQFYMICMSAFIGFLIYAEALAYTTTQA